MREEGFFIKSEDLKYSFSGDALRNSLDAEQGASDLPSVSYLDMKYSDVVYLPLSLFSSDLAPLQAIVKYSKEILGLSNKRISELIGRDLRTIWLTYKRVEKMPLPMFREPSLSVPISIFKNDRFSALEALVSFLRKLDLSYSQISKLIARDQRTVWTVYNRAVKKGRAGNED
jgi:hypothetical protein